MNVLVQSFMDKIMSRGTATALNSLSTIVSRSNTLTSSVHHHQRPRYVSIGPLHRRNHTLQRMEDHKWWLMQASRFQFVEFEKMLACFVGLKDLEDRTRETYSVVVNMKSDEFVQMLFLDAYFIILRVTVEHRTSRGKIAPSAQQNLLAGQPPIGIEQLVRYRLFDFDELVLKEIDIDLMTLDNQIPFFVLEYIWKWLTDCLHWDSTLDLFKHFDIYFNAKSNCSFETEVHHMLHLLHYSMTPEPLERCENDGRKYWIPSAKELTAVGIEFRLTKDPCSLLDIKFEDGVIYIPTLTISERQQLRLQNLVDFEQSVPGITTHFTTFVRFMSCLLSKKTDVRSLSQLGIIENKLGSDKDAQLFFQNLRQRCSYLHADSFLDDVFININNHLQSRRERWKASFRHKYCSNPWVTLSVMGGIILFILTFLQTFFAVYSYFHPLR